MKNFNISELFIDEISLFYNGIKLDNKSEKSLKEIGISNNTTILMIYDGLLFGCEYIELYKIKKNICIFHNKKLTLNCIECNMEICDKCKINHQNHSIVKLTNKYLSLNDDLKEFETFILNNENKKRDIYKKVEQNIISFEKYKKINKELENEIKKVIQKMLIKFYKDLEKGQNLLFLAKILFDTYIKLEKKNDKIILNYKNNIHLINNYFCEKKIKEFDLKNFQLANLKLPEEDKYTYKCVYKSYFNFIPQIELKYNDVKIIDREIIDSLFQKIFEIFKGKDVKIIKIKKGSLSIGIALNYLIKEKLEIINMENKTEIDILEELNKFLGMETKDIKKILKDNLFIAQKDKQFKPDFATENLYDLEPSSGELIRCIKENNNNDVNFMRFQRVLLEIQ